MLEHLQLHAIQIATQTSATTNQTSKRRVSLLVEVTSHFTASRGNSINEIERLPFVCGDNKLWLRIFFSSLVQTELQSMNPSEQQHISYIRGSGSDFTLKSPEIYLIN